MHYLSIAAFSVIGLVMPLGAQKQIAPDTEALRVRLQAATSIRAAAGRVDAGGWDYEAVIRENGMSFTPALGAAAATTQRLGLTPTEFGRAGAMREVAAAVPRVQGDVVSQRRAPGVFERYAVRAAGLELSWKFDSPQSGTGDLVVRYELDSTMPVTVRADGGVGFLLPDVGGVSIGSVTGIDAAGMAVPGTITVEGSRLELRLPGEFVANATYPLVLDPLIGTQLLATTNASWDDSQPDVAYDWSNDVYLVVYRRVFSATSQAIRAQRIDGSSVAMIGSFLVIQGQGSGGWLGRPTVANINTRDTFVIAWEYSASLFDDLDIRCCSVAAASGVVSSITTVASNAGDEADPDISGDNSARSTVASGGALIVYTEDGVGVQVSRVVCSTIGAQPTLVSTTLVSSSSSAKYPAISKSSPGLGAFMITWVGPATFVTGSSVFARAYDRFGAALGPAYAVATGSAVTGAMPRRSDVDGDGEDYVVLYEFMEPGGSVGTSGASDIYARGIRWDGSSIVPNGSSTAISSVGSLEEREPAITCCGSKFVALHAKQFLPGTNNFDVSVSVLSADCTICGPGGLLTGLNGTLLRNVEHQPAICSKYGGGGDSPDALIVFAESDDSPPFASSIIAQQYRAYTDFSPNMMLGSPCGTSATIDTRGPFAVGNEDFAVTVTGLPPLCLPVINFGLPNNTLPFGICGSCMLIDPLVAFYIPAVGTTATYEWPLTCTSYPFLGIQFDTQWTVISPGNSFCSLLTDFTWTRRMRITLGL